MGHIIQKLPYKMNAAKSFFQRTPYQLPLFLTLLVLVVLNACDQKKENARSDKPQPTQPVVYNIYKDANLSVEVFKVDSIDHNGSRGWGYNILIDGTIHIHQPNIPAIMGNNGFSSEEKALQAGEFVIQKLRNNIMPPSVTPEELDSLGLLD